MEVLDKPKILNYLTYSPKMFMKQYPAKKQKVVISKQKNCKLQERIVIVKFKKHVRSKSRTEGTENSPFSNVGTTLRPIFEFPSDRPETNFRQCRGFSEEDLTLSDEKKDAESEKSLDKFVIKTYSRSCPGYSRKYFSRDDKNKNTNCPQEDSRGSMEIKKSSFNESLNEEEITIKSENSESFSDTIVFHIKEENGFMESSPVSEDNTEMSDKNTKTDCPQGDTVIKTETSDSDEPENEEKTITENSRSFPKSFTPKIIIPMDRTYNSLQEIRDNIKAGPNLELLALNYYPENKDLLNQKLQQVEYITSMKGHLKVIFNYFTYTKRKVAISDPSRIYWNCSRKTRFHCTAGVHTKGGFLIKSGGFHFHEPHDPIDLEIAKFKAELKNQTLVTDDSPKQILNRILPENKAVLKRLPSNKKLIKRVYTLRAQKRKHPDWHKQMLDVMSDQIAFLMSL